MSNFKEEYNYWVAREKKAEEFFKNNTVEECLKFIELYQDIIREKGKVLRKLEKELGRELSEEEKWEGVNE